MADGGRGAGPPVIFWDFDGTLAFRGKLFASSLRMAMDECGIYPHIGVDDLVPLLKDCLPWHKPELEHTDVSTADDWWERLLYPALDAALIRCGVDEKNARAISQHSRKHAVDPQYYDVYEDTQTAMKLAAGLGFRQFILSNHVPELPDITRSLGLLRYAERCLTSACEGYEKPHPALYQKALAAAGNPGDPWMVGDNLQSDVLGARQCGYNAILVRKPPADCGIPYSETLPGAVRLIQRRSGSCPSHEPR